MLGFLHSHMQVEVVCGVETPTKESKHVRVESVALTGRYIGAT